MLLAEKQLAELHRRNALLGEEISKLNKDSPGGAYLLCLEEAYRIQEAIQRCQMDQDYVE